MDCLFDTEKPHFSTWLRLERPYDLFTISMNQGPRDVPPPAALLYFAACSGFRGLVERLIVKNPQQIHLLGGAYGTPFNVSVHGGHIEVAQLLFEHGADINSCSADSWTPLHIASQAGHLEIGKWLLDQGADVNSQQNRGFTPLHFAAFEGHLDVDTPCVSLPNEIADSVRFSLFSRFPAVSEFPALLRSVLHLSAFPRLSHTIRTAFPRLAWLPAPFPRFGRHSRTLDDVPRAPPAPPVKSDH